MRAIELIELMGAKPGASVLFCASWRDSGGCRATGLSESGADGFSCDIGVGVGFVSGVGMECGARLARLRKELNEDTATSGDCGDRREGVDPVFMSVSFFEVYLISDLR